MDSVVIVVSEIGDKTFLMYVSSRSSCKVRRMLTFRGETNSAAILSMRHPRTTVFSGALMALAVMSLLSSLLGTIMPALLPKRYTTIAAALLFFVFGARMLQEGMEMDAGREKIEEEMREVQKEVEEAEEEVAGRGGSIPLTDLEEGIAAPLPERVDTPTHSNKRRNSVSVPSKEDALATLREGTKNLAHLFFSPIFIQAFVLTFLAEWGDRSQITTIALAAAHVRFLVPV
jgi:putative Ca2+/H+ antiporter (TMEM165/GDT1 family)